MSQGMYASKIAPRVIFCTTSRPKREARSDVRPLEMELGERGRKTRYRGFFVRVAITCAGGLRDLLPALDDPRELRLEGRPPVVARVELRAAHARDGALLDLAVQERPAVVPAGWPELD